MRPLYYSLICICVRTLVLGLMIMSFGHYFAEAAILKERIVTQQSSYWAGAVLVSLLFMCILHRSTGGVVFLKNRTDLSTFLVEHLCRNLLAHRIAQGGGDAIWHRDRPHFFQAPSASAPCNVTVLQTRHFLFSVYVLFCVFVISFLHSGKFCPPLRSSSPTKSFSGVPRQLAHPVQGSQNTPFRSLSTHLFWDIWIICLHICLLEKVVNFLSRGYISFTFVSQGFSLVPSSSGCA